MDTMCSANARGSSYIVNEIQWKTTSSSTSLIKWSTSSRFVTETRKNRTLHHTFGITWVYYTQLALYFLSYFYSTLSARAIDDFSLELSSEMNFWRFFKRGDSQMDSCEILTHLR